MEIHPGNTAAVIVSFNDPETVRRCIVALAGQVARIIVVDNSSPTLRYPDSEGGTVQVLHNQANLGLGEALNQGLRESLRVGFAWTLLLDQDSLAQEGMITATGKALSCLPAAQKERVAMVTPTIYDTTTARLLPAIRTGIWRNHKVYPGDPDRFIDFRITSGSLLRNRVTEEIGLMDAPLFIDYLDYDYCFRLRQAGYLILLAHEARLHHALGSAQRRVFGLPVVEHAPLRVYYQTRNRLTIMHRYGRQHPSVLISEFCRMILKPWKIVLLERSKRDKLRYYRTGIRDFLKGSRVAL